ncbi:MAG: LysR family transcriptional regulator [Myxococcota bacterium]
MQNANEIGRLDLNLLVSLQALLEEGSVTRAAKRMGMTQPAMSHSLARLRQLFSDPLLVRNGRGMATTPRAESLREPLARVLSDARRLMEPREFEPGLARGAMRLGVSEYTALVVLPLVLPAVRRLAPGLRLDLEPWRAHSHERLAQGDLDLAVHAEETAPSGIFHRRLFTDRHACVVRAGHPVVAQGLTLGRYLELDHAAVTLTGAGPEDIHAALQRTGREREVVLRIPSFLAAPALIASTDLVLTLPRRLAKRLAGSADLAVLELPLALPLFPVSLAWHERRHHDRAHTWLRGLVAEEMGRAEEPPSE